MQITMFLTLGLQVFPSRLAPVIGVGLFLALFLILIARPISVFLSLALSSMSYQEKGLVAWVGLRGAVPIVLATFPLLAGINKADTIFHIVFFIVLTSVLLQGPFIPWIARWLAVEAPPEGKTKYLLQLEPEARSEVKL
jgi:cell volume regulation protein A